MMPTLTVDGIEVTVPNGAIIPNACKLPGKEMRRCCYHEPWSGGEAFDYPATAT